MCLRWRRGWLVSQEENGGGAKGCDEECLDEEVDVEVVFVEVIIKEDSGEEETYQATHWHCHASKGCSKASLNVG